MDQDNEDTDWVATSARGVAKDNARAGGGGTSSSEGRPPPLATAVVPPEVMAAATTLPLGPPEVPVA